MTLFHRTRVRVRKLRLGWLPRPWIVSCPSCGWTKPCTSHMYAVYIAHQHAGAHRPRFPTPDPFSRPLDDPDPIPTPGSTP